MVKDYVEPEDLKAHVVWEIDWLASFVVVGEYWLSDNQSFNDYIFDLIHQQRNIEASLYQTL